MIVVKGQPENVKQLDELTFVQKCEVFVKFHTTQALVIFGSVYGFWTEVLPDDVKADIFNDIPWLLKYKTAIYVTSLAIVFYKTKMGVQTIAVRSNDPAQPTEPENQ